MEEDGVGGSRPDGGGSRRYAVAGGCRWQVRIRTDCNAAGGQDRNPEVQKRGACRRGVAQRRPHRPRRRLGRDGGGRRAGLGAFRQRCGFAAGGAVWRRSEAVSTAPYCVGIPRRGQDPIVLDFATSIVAEGKVLVASRGGKKLPKGALIDLDGSLSEDPAVLYGPHSAEGPRDHTKGTGAIRAFGEHKGSGLAFICELLGGALTGTGATAPDRRFANGMFAIYVDPKVVDTSNFFDGEISRYIEFIRATKPIAGVDAVLIPGDPERKMRADRTRNGVPLPDDTWAAIVNTAREMGVSERSIQRAVN